MTILAQILESKKIEVEEKRERHPIATLEKSLFFNKPTSSFKDFLLNKSKNGIIAEFKRKSPSRGIINDSHLVTTVVKGYQDAGASAVSVLTDYRYFGGDNNDLTAAREVLEIPLLRKDFVIDEYQLVEAKSLGADVILLIAAALAPADLQRLARFAKFLQLEVLMEVHNETELMDNLHDEIDVIGVNNRNLKDFSENIDNSLRLASLIPEKYVKISESSIKDASMIATLKQAGYSGFLIGEKFMTQTDPGAACRNLSLEVEAIIAQTHKYG